MQTGHIRARQELAQQVDVLRQRVSEKEVEKESLLNFATASFVIDGDDESTIVVIDDEDGGNHRKYPET